MILTPHRGRPCGNLAFPPCLTAWFQPQWSLLDGSLAGYEALLRVRGPDGLRLPAGLLRDMDALPEHARLAAHRVLLKYMVHVATRTARVHHVKLAVNVPSFLLEDGEAVEIMAGAGGALRAEILETYPLTRPRAARAAISALHAAGIEVAVDDFGAGHADGDMLQALPGVDTVKIDAGVLAAAEGDGGARLRHLCGWLHACGVRVVVEGVENATQHDIALEAGADVEQGYWCGRPAARPYRIAALEAAIAAREAA